uniref:Peptide transporter PTR1 n=1 Tax=Triticum urartu TaxID=4572 RepID=A0A8R7QHL1_TRIUA
MPLLGAFVADAYLGRFRTIAAFMSLYIAGLALLTLTATVPGLRPPDCAGCKPAAAQTAAFFTALYLIAVGTGGIKPCVSSFGADQFDDADPREMRSKSSFFNWFYMSINVGALVASSVLVWVQMNVGWGWGFGIPAAAMGRRRRQLPHGQQALQVPEARGQPAHQDAAGRGRRLQEVACPPPRRRLPAARSRLARRQGRHRGQQEAGAHGSAEVPGQGRRACDDARARRRSRGKPVEAVHGDAGGGAQEHGAAAAGVGERHRHVGGVQPDEHHVRAPGQHPGPAHGRLLQDPRRLALHLRHHRRHRVGARLRPAHRPRRTPDHGPPARVHAAAAHGHRPGDIHLLHGGRRGAGGCQAPRRRHTRHAGLQGVPAHVLLLAGAAVLHRGRGGGVHVRGADRVLLRPVAGRHEEHGVGAVAHVQRAGQLPEHAAGGDRDGHLHQERRPRVDPG